MREPVTPVLAALLALFLASSLGVGDGLSAQEGPPEVTSLRFQGNLQFQDRALANAIITRETECSSFILAPFCWAGAGFALDPYLFSAREFARDEARLRLFYYQRGYREAVVDTVVERPSPEEVRITFQIQEGDPVRVEEMNFEGLEELPDSSLVKGLSIGVGDPLSAPALDAARDTLLTRLRNRGFAHADVLRSYFIPRSTPYQARVSFDLYPGPLTRFGPFHISGNVTVSETVVRRMLPFRPGDLYSQELRFAGQRNLYNLDILSFADIVPDTTFLPDTIVPLTIQVAEGDAHRVRAGVGFSTADCVNSEARWASRNFFGGARRLQVTGRVSNLLVPQLREPLCGDVGKGEYGELNWLVSAEFHQPWVGSPRNSLTTSIFGERQSLPDIFVRRAFGAGVALTHTLTRSTPLTFSYRPQLSRLDAAEVFFCSNYLVCTQADIRILQGANWIAPIGVSLSRDRRNQPLSPTRGYSALADLEHAGDWTGSDFRYTRLLAEGTWYTQGESRWVLATRLRGGWVRPEGFRGLGRDRTSSDIVHPDKRLYAGGSNSVRGYAQNRLGPRVLQLTDVGRLLATEGEDGNPVCTPDQILDLTCDPDLLADDVFLPRPTGGTSLLEGSLEFRFPLTGVAWEAATFLDFGQVWEEDSRLDLGDLEFTPGLGIRYFSPIGPIRVDLAYRFAGGERLQVVTSQLRPFDSAVDDPDDRLRGPDGAFLPYLPSEELAVLGPKVLYGDLGTWSLQRFQIHLSIGQAF